MIPKKRLGLPCASIRHLSATIRHTAGGVWNTPRWQKLRTPDATASRLRCGKAPALSAQPKPPEVGGK